jgi:transposase
MPCFRDPGKLVFQYREAAKRFQMIQDTGQAVLIPWDKAGVDLEKQIRSKAFAENPQMRRVLLRNCQRHMVSVYENVYRSLLGNDIELLHETVPVLLNLSMYDKKLGLRLDKAGQHEPESLIA